MGWWNAGHHGESLMQVETGLVWGDGPADILDDAIKRIKSVFEEEQGRPPTEAELRSGLEFSLGLDQ